MKKWISITLGILQLFIAIGALAGGAALVRQPTVALGMPLSYLEGSPFKDYLVPGIVLFIFNGLGSLAAGILTLRCYRYAGEIAMVFGAGLMVWILVQIQFIPYSWFQPTYFGLGLVELALGWGVWKGKQQVQ